MSAALTSRDALGKAKPVIAIIEDRKEDRFFLTLAVQEAFADASVFEFSYAEEALVFLRSPGRPRIDIILVDISMPKMNGFEFADAYHLLYPELKGQALLYVTSSSIDPEDRRRSVEHEAVAGFLEKPVTPDVLKDLPLGENRR